MGHIVEEFKSIYVMCRLGGPYNKKKKTVPDLGLENAVQERGHRFFLFTIRTDP